MSAKASSTDSRLGSRLEQLLRAGQFAVTAELGPPQGADAVAIRWKAALLKGACDAVNLSDNPTAIVRMSSIAAGAILIREGLEPVIQMTCRDRNRLAIQSDLLGAHALGMRSLLCLTGDHQTLGDHPEAKNVYDIDSLQLVKMVASMGTEGVLQSGKAIDGLAPRFFVGAAASPFADPVDFRPYRLAKKVRAGAAFIQTQVVSDIEAFKLFMQKVRNLGLHERSYILASVGTQEDHAGTIRGLSNESLVEGCIQLIGQLREIEGVAGVHIMARDREEVVKPIAEGAGLMPRPILEGWTDSGVTR